MFGCVTKIGVKRAELVQKFVPQSRVEIFSQRTYRVHPIRPQTDVLVRFCTIWVHFEQFGCLTKLGAKRAEQVQKFVQRNCVGIFRTKRTRSTPLDPKLMFLCVSYYWVHLEPFGRLTKLGAKQAELAQKFVPRSRVGIFRNERTRSIKVDPKLMFWCVLFYLGALRTVGCLT